MRRSKAPRTDGSWARRGVRVGPGEGEGTDASGHAVRAQCCCAAGRRGAGCGGPPGGQGWKVPKGSKQ